MSKYWENKYGLKPGDNVIISSSDIFFEGLRGQKAVVKGIAHYSDHNFIRVVAKDHFVPNYPKDFEWEIVPELLQKIEED